MPPVLAYASRALRRAAAARTSSLTLPLLALGACSAPAERPLDPGDLAATVDAREATSAELAAALELSGLQPLAVSPPAPELLADPTRSEFWHACAWVWSPATRAARRRVEVARARAGSAGQPGPIEGVVEVKDLGDPALQTRMMITFDMIGLLGLGPAAAARALADAETRAAMGELEEAVWRARFEVDAARARLAAARAARASLSALADEAARDGTRIAILERHGRLDGGSLAAAELALRALGARLAELELEQSRAREALARAAGLPSGAAALDVPAGEMLDALLPTLPIQTPTSEELLARLPELRRALLEYAVAEARLRDEAAARWPSLRLGPHLLWADGDFLLGALAGSGIPWPGSLDGRIAAASAEREAARERIEDALLGARVRGAGARQRHAAATALLEGSARPAAEQSERLWTAARARFAVEPAALGNWADALRKRAEALAGLENARRELALAGLETQEAAGPAPDPERVAASAQVQR